MRRAAGLGLELPPLLDAKAMLLVDDRESEASEGHPFLQQGVRPDHDAGPTVGNLVERLPPCIPRQGPGEQRDRHVDALEQRPNGLGVLPCEEIGRGEQRALVAGRRRERQRIGSDSRLARANVTLKEPEHRLRRPEVGPHVCHRSRLVVRELDTRVDLRPEAGHDGRAGGRLGVVGNPDRQALRLTPLAAPSHHAELQSSSNASRRRAASRPSNDAG